VPPHRRHVNQVFQSYALFPHLSVRDNIAFGLRMQRLPAREVAARVAEAVALVALEGCEDRAPHQLSGGQRQRVALARALAPQPAVLLLDEPLSALDARLREAMQVELKRLQRRLGTTFVFVTHDQAEAMTMSDRIALVHEGRIEQCGPAAELYLRPATPFAAAFIGETNLVVAERIRAEAGLIVARLEGGLEVRLPAARWPEGAARVRVSIRPEKVHLGRGPLGEGTAFEARVEEETFKGALDHFSLLTAAGTRLKAVRANESAWRESITAGERVWGAIHPDDIVVVRVEP
jgi:spermidine/putrescine transport system ATP-binding protein